MANQTIPLHRIISPSSTKQEFATSGATRMVISDSGNLGIGTPTPAFKLHVVGNSYFNGDVDIVSSSPSLLFSVPGGGLDSRIHNDGSGNFIFGTGTNSATPTERMRLNSSGYLLVGKSNTTFSSAGIELRSGNLGARFIRNFAEPIFVNRTGNDGNIIKIYCQTTEVGNIGSQGTRPYFGNAINFSIKPDDANSGSLVPANQNGVPNNNVADIGLSSNRWNDLYLGGGVYLGGTATSNKLDDYEEGDWTPALTGSGGTSNTAYTTQQGKYTKIGNVVTATFHILLSNEGQLTGTTRISGLPYNGSGGPNYQTATLMCGNTNLDKDQRLTGMQYAVNAFIYLMIEESDVALVQASGNGAFKDNTEISGTVTYFTNS